MPVSFSLRVATKFLSCGQTFACVVAQVCLQTGTGVPRRWRTCAPAGVHGATARRVCVAGSAGLGAAEHLLKQRATAHHERGLSRHAAPHGQAVWLQAQDEAEGIALGGGHNVG